MDYSYSITLTPRKFDYTLPYYDVKFNIRGFDEDSEPTVEIGHINFKMYVMHTLNVLRITLDEMIYLADSHSSEDPLLLSAFKELVDSNVMFKDFTLDGKFITIDEVFVEPSHRGNRIGLQMLDKALDMLKETMDVELALLQASPLSDSMTETEKSALRVRLANYYKKLGFELLENFHSHNIMMKVLFERNFI